MTTTIRISIEGNVTEVPQGGFAGAVTGGTRRVPGDAATIEIETDATSTAAESGMWVRDAASAAADAIRSVIEQKREG